MNKKELSIKGKAKSYDDAIAHAKLLLKTIGNATLGNLVLKHEFETMFPELKESEDERIRKGIIRCIKGNMPDNDFRKEYLAWLEKQGEQKPADKIEPKFNFKVGQWIVATGKCIYLIAKIDGLNVTLIDTNGDECVFDTSSLDDAYQWTIQDAKDGDVLSYVTGEENLWIMIYWSLYEPYEGHVHYHALLVNNNFSDKGTCCISIDNLKPATKEQRDLLFQKMTEAGYEWDAEKKELYKIEQKPAEEYNIAGIGSKNAQGKLGEMIKKLKPVNEVLEQKPWSEEEEKKQNYLIALLQNSTMNNPALRSVNEGLEEWLKSLKGRVQPKQEWSEEDEAVINKAESWLDTLCDYLKDSSSECISDVKDVINKLKSLKDRYTWKPSDKQLDALHDVAVYVDKSMFPYRKGILMKLYEQLKKLKG